MVDIAEARLASSAPPSGWRGSSPRHVRDTAVPGSEWTVGDVAAHVALGTESYTSYVHGATEPWADVSDIAGWSLARSHACKLAAEPERDLSALSTRISAAAATMLDATAGRDGHDRIIWNGHPLELASMVAIGLGECPLHGLDLARALDRVWPIERSDARLVLEGALPLLPLLVNPATPGAAHPVPRRAVTIGDPAAGRRFPGPCALATRPRI